MPRFRKCEYKHIEGACFDCPYAKQGEPDCIDGMPVKKPMDAKKLTNQIINKKYYHSTELHRQKNIERCRNYKSRNRDKVYKKNAEWVENHKEDANKIRRKWMRKKRIEDGSYKYVGTIRYKGQEAFVYRSRYFGKFNYFGFLGKDYFELEEDEIVWLWIRKEA